MASILLVVLLAIALIQFLRIQRDIERRIAAQRNTPRHQLVPRHYKSFTEVEKASLWVTDLEFLRLHYAKTLNHWCRRFEANREKIARMYDERFCRMWEFYLVSAEMMFRTGSQLVFQMQLARKRDAAPIVRDYMTDLQRHYREIDSTRQSSLRAND